MKLVLITPGQSDIATKPITPGAGVDPRKVCKPSKRLRNWHREPTHGLPQIPLKQYALALTTSDGMTPSSLEHKATAQRWLASKGIKP